MFELTQEYLCVLLDLVSIFLILSIIQNSKQNKKQIENNYKITSTVINRLKTYPTIKIHNGNNRDEINNIYIDISQYFNNNSDIFSRLVEINGNVLKYASYEIRNNRNICIKAISTDINAFNYISSELRQNITFLYQIIDLNPIYILSQLPEKELYLIKDNNIIMSRAILFDKNCINLSSVILQNMYYLQGYINIDYEYEKIKKKKLQ